MSIGTIDKWPLIAVPRSFTSSCRTVLTMRSGLSSAPALFQVMDSSTRKIQLNGKICNKTQSYHKQKSTREVSKILTN